MSAGTLTQSPRVQEVLDKCRRQILMHTLLRGIAGVLAVIVTSVLVSTGLDYLVGI